MTYPLFMTKEQVKELEYEILSQKFYTYLTRYLLDKIEDNENENIITIKNQLINLSNTIQGKKIYPLMSDSDGIYHDAEYAWHNSSFFLIMRELNTMQFIEFAIHLLKFKFWTIEFLNEALREDNSSFLFTYNHYDGYSVDINNSLENSIGDTGHPNVRTLVGRMEDCLDKEDYGGVIHASASVFETMAKDIIGSHSIEHKTLKSFFDRYRKDSKLISEILDYILSIYETRNTCPLAGHGSTKEIEVSLGEAVTLVELTKSFVKIEYSLHNHNIVKRDK